MKYQFAKISSCHVAGFRRKLCRVGLCHDSWLEIVDQIPGRLLAPSEPSIPTDHLSFFVHDVCNVVHWDVGPCSCFQMMMGGNSTYDYGWITPRHVHVWRHDTQSKMLGLVISFLTWLSRLDVWTRGMQLGWANGEDTLDVKEHLGYAASWPLIKILLDQMIREDCLRFKIILSNSGQLKFWISRHKSITWMVSDFLYNHNITFWWFKFSI